MRQVVIGGLGAVSPAGWGLKPLREALRAGIALPTRELAHPGARQSLTVRVPPPPATRPSFVTHARLRRTSPISQYTVAAALEAIGPEEPLIRKGELRLGIVLAVMCGCVNYSRRFYDEVLKNPSTASPLLFPETVFNAPASHLAALLGVDGLCYTIMGDPGAFLIALAVAANWIRHEKVDRCLLIGAEEIDWLTADALRLFDRRIIMSDGAGALYLRPEETGVSGVQLSAITDPFLFTNGVSRAEAARRARAELPKQETGELLCDGLQGSPKTDRDELAAWGDWQGPRLSPKTIFGEGFMAAAAWQCVAAADAVSRHETPAATVSIVGWNEQAIAARFSSRNGSSRIPA